MAQIGWNITNNFGAPSGKGGAGGLLPLIVLGAVVLAVISAIGAVVLPTLVAANTSLLLLLPFFKWGALGLGGVALGGGGVWTSRNALKTAQINKENGERYERMRNAARGVPQETAAVPTRRRPALPPKTIFVASTQVGQIEQTEVSRPA